ncbi:MAG: NAD(P)-binding domain-containing protein [Candidatus Moraniibacteriota bacterium]|nr:MAG: NAD(P)-binding domain-containing protein [Candidatus Moranbacteria bacterium]
MKRVAVIGSGVVGSATGKGFLEKGHDVVFYDVREETIANLRKQGLSAEHINNVDVQKSDIFFFVVSTPTENGKVNLKYLKNAVTVLGKKLKKRKEYFVVVVRSTVPPRTTQDIISPILEKMSGKKAGKDFGLAMNPEYLREVSAEEDFSHPWVLTLGSLDERTKLFLDEIFSGYSCPVHHVSLSEAETQKYVHNLFNAVKIAFFNEMRIASKEIGIDPDRIFEITTESAEGIWNKKYGIKNIGPFDGMCLPKDTQAFFHWAKKRGIRMGLLGSTIQSNKYFEEFWEKNKK